MDSKVSDGIWPGGEIVGSTNSGVVHFMTGGIAEEAAPLMMGRKQKERQRRGTSSNIPFPSRACSQSGLTYFH